MQQRRILALILIAICFLASVYGIQRRQADEGLVFRPTRDRLELISLEGTINSSRSNPNGALAVRDHLFTAGEDESIKGVLLVINSPGGTVGPSEEVYQAAMQLREKKPLVVSMLNVAASGGYYVASAANKIYSNSGALTGSIGVILSDLNVRTLLDRVGVEPVTFKTGTYKDILSPFRPVTDVEKKLLQELLQSTYEQFVQDVSKGRTDPSMNRTMTVAAVRKVADGRIFTGVQAKVNGLVDELGTQEDAEKELRNLARQRFGLDESIELPLERVRPMFWGTFGCADCAIRTGFLVPQCAVG
ncbi:MAG: signal peptide peptidase SppA, partial [Oscillatoriales cyanobacterium SM2_2_1]|nr:signal peptide peptidase SppA [Oscillatoriales cyanobacterium SM2_2_1]